MATRRRYKHPQGYRDGGRVLADVAIADDESGEAGGFPSGILGDHLEHAGAALQDGTVPRSPPPPAEPPPEENIEDNPLWRGLQAQRRAEELQREAAQAKPSSFEQKIAHLSEAKKHFLRQYPLVVEDPTVQAVFNRHYAESKAKFAEDSPEQFSHLITATVRDLEHRRQLALASESDDVAVQRLEDEAEALQEPPAPAPSPAPSRHRSIPMSAPVSRNAPSYSGRSQSDSNPMTLSAEERDIAHRSYSAPDMTDAQKEYAYVKAKRRMIQAKLDGEIQS